MMRLIASRTLAHRISLLAISGLFLLETAGRADIAHAQEPNSNLWPVHRDEVIGFRISYPPEWIITPPKGKYVQFSVFAPSPGGICSVVMRIIPITSVLNQSELNSEIEALPQTQQGWIDIIGLPSAQVSVVSSRIGHIFDVSALVGIVEIRFENLEGAFTRKQ